MLGPHGHTPSGVTAQEPLAVGLSRCTRSGRRGIPPHQALRPRALTGAPAGIVTSRLPHAGPPISAAVQRRAAVAWATTQGGEPFLRPRLHMLQPMRRWREAMGHPDDGHPAQPEPLPVAMRRDGRVPHGCTPIRATWARHNGLSSTRSLRMVKGSCIPRPSHTVQNPFKFARTVSNC